MPFTVCSAQHAFDRTEIMAASIYTLNAHDTCRFSLPDTSQALWAGTLEESSETGMSQSGGLTWPIQHSPKQEKRRDMADAA